MKPWNSAYRTNVKEIVNWIKNKQLFPNVYLDGYSNEWIGCDIVCSREIVIWCCTGEYVDDRKSRPYYIIRYIHGDECNRYEVFNLKQIYKFFELSKDIGYKNAGEYIDKQTKLINEQLKISKDFK